MSAGVAEANAYVFRRQTIELPQGCANDPQEELRRFCASMEAVVEETCRLSRKARSEGNTDSAEILDAHLTILNDQECVSGPIEQMIGSDCLYAEQAVVRHMDALADMFSQMDDAYMCARSSDILELKNRLLFSLSGVCDIDLSCLPGPVILVAEELTPSDTAIWDRQNVRGIITCFGGRTSHMAIIARNTGIPAIVGAADAVSETEMGEPLVMDGESGEYACRPAQPLREEFHQRETQRHQFVLQAETFRGKATVSADNFTVDLAANIGSASEAVSAVQADAEGVGLFRSEFLFIGQSQPPGEEEQYRQYREVLETMRGKFVIVRTLDIGGDKEAPCLKMEPESNPFLGYRAIRFSLDHPELFKAQLRALLRAGVYGDLKIMIPMISAVEEMQAVRTLLKECEQELEREGIPFRPDIPLGMMVETPAAAILAGQFAKVSDFFSIGTNDLLQYTVAVDRGNEKISHLYSFYHPAVLSLIQNTICAALEAGIPCGMCGEAAGDPLLVPVLFGMGLQEFSMSASGILATRMLISRLNRPVCTRLAETVLRLPSACAVEKSLRLFQKEIEEQQEPNQFDPR